MDWKYFKESKKAQYAERVAKTPDRIEVATSFFERYKFYYMLKNKDTGHFHVIVNNNIFQFWASTGKIFGSTRRGIKNFILLLKKEVESVQV